ncbi:DUF1816 domain-containing protein [Nostoc sp. 'Peltigera membranacea cyanobiont' N6]|uniref:DUF1816 domain-containing protein n=1 Tax=Nostoc sp. 'Peltigera membranacea cyanobiont' N6 TaxID=1261031 RepID=UPI000CF33B4E|nr:DUF1816 domain-containing protein [Nostoc sp. 'Peltigera membranacea cyanobiont' N6]AVH65634.1 protein of unknown function DUF1816 [Nostoc sp. 'Peltigera membranacea cyanobiont' N6]
MNLFQSNQSEFAWWVEINTAVPRCTYYFGPFDSEKEAQLSRSGYVEDLYQEEARDIIALVKQCQPDVLTIFHEKEEVHVYSF